MSVYIYGAHAIEHALRNPKRTIHKREHDRILTEPLVYRLDQVAGNKIVILDKLLDMRNIGAIIRSAAAFGFESVIISSSANCPNVLDQANYPVMAKCASGGLEYIRLIVTGNIRQACDTLKSSGYWIVGLDEQGAVTMPQFDKVALVIGQEGRGLRQLIKSNCDILYKIPTSASFSCLNASVAVSVAMSMLFV